MPRRPDPKKEYLELHGVHWRVVVSVPAEARRALGASKLKHNLGTDSLRMANVLKRPHVEAFKRRIAEALAGARSPDKADIQIAVELGKIAAQLKRDGRPEEWEAFREAVYEKQAEIRYKDSRWISFIDPEDGPVDAEVELPEQAEKARTFSDIAYGRATPIGLMHQEYLAQLFVKPRTKADDERALKLLLGWCTKNEIRPVLEEFDVKRAYAFADALKGMTGLDHVTCNKYVSRLSSYWTYMLPRCDAVQSNVFAKVSVKGPKAKHDEKERAFTNQELADLLTGPATPHMYDLMLIGALTGARLDAIVDLKVKDTRFNCLLFKAQKKEPWPRYVPVNPQLAEAVARRTLGKGPEDDLFPEWPPVKKMGSMRERSFKTSNHFTIYRRSCGVDDLRPERRRSRVNFHSFRRWFISRMQQADVPGDLISAIVGHQTGSITLDVYSEGPAMRAARRAVAKVKLPPLDGGAVIEPVGLKPAATSGARPRQAKG